MEGKLEKREKDITARIFSLRVATRSYSRILNSASWNSAARRSSSADTGGSWTVFASGKSSETIPFATWVDEEIVHLSLLSCKDAEKKENRLQENPVVSLVGGMNIHITFVNSNQVARLEALATTSLTAGLKGVDHVPGG